MELCQLLDSTGYFILMESTHKRVNQLNTNLLEYDSMSSIKYLLQSVINSMSSIEYLFQSVITKLFRNSNDTMTMGLSRSKNRGHIINTVIDVGASNGSWTLLCKKYFPNAFYFLIEAQVAHEDSLKKLKSKTANVDYIIKAAGDNVGVVYFDDRDPFGGVASHKSFDKVSMVVVPMTTVDNVVKERKLEPPFLLKLDTHGFEIPILNGALETLRNTEVLVIEAYNFKLTAYDSKSENVAIKFYELCMYLENKGFRCIDIMDILRRPNDNALWQMDFVFIKDNNKIFAKNDYI